MLRRLTIACCLFGLIFGFGFQIGSAEENSFGDPRDPSGKIGPRIVPLHQGHNMVMWTGGEIPIVDALKDIRNLVEAVFIWDAEAKEWRTYHPDLPAAVNDLKILRFGEGVWIIVKKDVTWEQPAPLH